MPPTSPRPLPAELGPETPVQYLKGAGPRRAETLARLEIRTVLDLLNHFPRAWADRSRLGSIAMAEVGHDLTILATVRRVDVSRRASRADTVVTLEDGTGVLQAIWFGQPYMKRHFEAGQQLMVSGTVGFHERKRLSNPEWEIWTEDVDSANVGRIVPIYPSTAGMSQRVLRGLVRQALELCLDQLEETLPSAVLSAEQLPGRREALRVIHFPEQMEAIDAARRRFIFEEALEIQMLLRWLRLERENRRPGIAFPESSALADRLEASLPFRLTEDQQTVLAEIRADMRRPTPMGRLLQGDVGSGKTVVALLAAARAVDAGYQAAIMAPTEVLAEQHLVTFEKLATPLGIRVVRLTGQLKSAERVRVLAEIRSGVAGIAVGTHALIQEGVEFHNLGLVVVDEQHRFGVLQRADLKTKGRTPDLLAMTATPIPRTLYLTRAADLKLSQIRSRPAGRGRVVTRVAGEASREKVYDVLRREIDKGRQVYVVYPLIDESEKIDLKAATVMFATLTAHPRLSGVRAGLLHGRLKAADKSAILDAFRAGTIDLLVTTTVIEVGIDVPNATVMVIEHPERFGLSQLHQLRGRIGRGSETSYCILIEESAGGAGHERLRLFETTLDGFILAEADLRFRGAGSILGVRQSGPAGFGLNILDPIRDEAVLERAHAMANRLANEDPQLLDPAWGGMRTRLKKTIDDSRRFLDAG
ncbi:MAG: ATP-dependent DNA helicase RecG [Candidatus Eisenbacteria bacterium]|nr:ATP-dependent DNA helicase RecG [Candidatus Eisenbacteria bacterium]